MDAKKLVLAAGLSTARPGQKKSNGLQNKFAATEVSVES